MAGNELKTAILKQVGAQRKLATNGSIDFYKELRHAWLRAQTSWLAEVKTLSRTWEVLD